jgi:hypothetical protein
MRLFASWFNGSAVRAAGPTLVAVLAVLAGLGHAGHALHHILGTTGFVWG